MSSDFLSVGWGLQSYPKLTVIRVFVYSVSPMFLSVFVVSPKTVDASAYLLLGSSSASARPSCDVASGSRSSSYSYALGLIPGALVITLLRAAGGKYFVSLIASACTSPGGYAFLLQTGSFTTWGEMLINLE